MSTVIGVGFGIWATFFPWISAVLAHRASQKDRPQSLIIAHLIMVFRKQKNPQNISLKFP